MFMLQFIKKKKNVLYFKPLVSHVYDYILTDRGRHWLFHFSLSLQLNVTQTSFNVTLEELGWFLQERIQVGVRVFSLEIIQVIQTLLGEGGRR